MNKTCHTKKTVVDLQFMVKRKQNVNLQQPTKCEHAQWTFYHATKLPQTNVTRGNPRAKDMRR